MSSQTGTDAPAPVHSERYLWYVVGVLTLASTLSFIDRQILNLMIGPVKRDLGGLSDFEVSLIMGLAFASVYNLLSYPAGRLADSSNRRNLMAAGVAAWSLMTALCGMAHTYLQLFLTRMGVGVGEATLGPAANSTLSDYFPNSRLPLAIGFVAAAPFIGQGLANIIGGPLIDYLESSPNAVLPIIGEVYSWQMVFLIVGLPGLVVAALFLTIREPIRRGLTRDDGKSVPFKEVWAFVKSRKTFFLLIFTGYLGLSIQGFALFSWLVEFFVRNHGWSKTEIGLTYGFIAMFVGITGSVFAGALASILIRRGIQDATLRIVFYGTLLLGPLAAIMTLLPSAGAAVALLIPVTFLMALPSGLIITTLQTIAPNELRGQAVAFYLISVSFLAYTFAPSLPPILSDFVFKDEGALGYSISILAVINYGVAAVCIGAGLKHYRAALDKARAWS